MQPVRSISIPVSGVARLPKRGVAQVDLGRIGFSGSKNKPVPTSTSTYIITPLSNLVLYLDKAESLLPKKLSGFLAMLSPAIVPVVDFIGSKTTKQNYFQSETYISGTNNREKRMIIQGEDKQILNFVVCDPESATLVVPDKTLNTLQVPEELINQSGPLPGFAAPQSIGIAIKDIPYGDPLVIEERDSMGQARYRYELSRDKAKDNALIIYQYSID